MPILLNSSNTDFDLNFAELLASKREVDIDVDETVATILNDIELRGDDAIIDFTSKFDHLDLTPLTFSFSAKEIQDAVNTVPKDEAKALELAAERIRVYHEKQVPQDAWWQDETGAKLGWKWTPVDRAGLYVPGGLASYPSSVLMNAIPAQVAGVKELIICSPTPYGQVNPLVLLAAKLSGVEKVYRIGGAQAIGAMAFGTSTIPKVDVITGPGNIFVAAAKRRVYGRVGIDMIAGPSEILVIADKHNNPDWIALDLLSQAEHDTTAQAILITDSSTFANAVIKAIDQQLKTLKRKDIAAKSWRDYGAVIIVDNLDEAAELSNRLAPEHLELCLTDAESYVEKIHHAGAIFIGSWTPEAIGDYISGPNHVLPTARTARFASGLSVLNFMKRTTLSMMQPSALKKIGPSGETLAKSESLEAHALSIRARLDHINEVDNG